MKKYKFSEAVKRLKSSEIRELMKLTTRPNLIVFGGGSPDPQLFPYESVKKIQSKWDAEKAAMAYQYGPTPGIPPIQKALRSWVTDHHISLEGQSIFVSSGAQQSLSLISCAFVNLGTKIVVENPTFIGAMACFQINGAEFLWAELENDGVDLNQLESYFKNDKPVFFYTIPNFQNPSGITMSMQKRMELLELAHKYQVLIIEDDPYVELYYEGSPEDYRSLKSLDKNNIVINIGTFSKMLSPGMRVGWMVGPELPVSKCEVARQSQDACGSSFTQMLCADYVSSGMIYPSLEKIREGYRIKRNLMKNAIESYFPDWIKRSEPKGGFFFWIDLQGRIGSKELFKRAIDKGVAVITGHAFMPPGDGERCCRLSFSSSKKEDIGKGIKILGDILKKL
ncbi:MAG: hypothetical protein B6244_07385 [Candidatus Cloacimonetes bacterium 4572_55]|nr:MAG: hypothetical protein B6244_07385 [Candidatus Cloacimonetes bacterium 4572_55]